MKTALMMTIKKTIQVIIVLVMGLVSGFSQVPQGWASRGVGGGGALFSLPGPELVRIEKAFRFSF